MFMALAFVYTVVFVKSVRGRTPSNRTGHAWNLGKTLANVAEKGSESEAEPSRYEAAVLIKGYDSH